MKTIDTGTPDIDLGMSEDTLAAIILEAKSYDAVMPESDEDEGSNDADDREVSVLEDQDDNPALQILSDTIESLSVDQQEALIALVWVGRGDFDASEWQKALDLAAERDNGNVAEYLAGIPLLGDFLEAGADTMGINVGASETRAMSHYEEEDTDRS
ncbi:DUF3775 domain-containing protein [Ponticaulis profundi]|uniref:DUF3775 domain-containing protein n=1 Tax=Ponticaulis profundi TaxID=2665222 RepID=A0ABW1S6P9_9PROT